MCIDLYCERNYETLNRRWNRRRTSVITYPCYRRSQAYMFAMTESIIHLASEDTIFERPTSIWTASTVFSSPCCSKEADALCNKRPNRWRIAMIYRCRGSVGLERTNPAFTGPMTAIISGISFLMPVRRHMWRIHRNYSQNITEFASPCPVLWASAWLCERRNARKGVANEAQIPKLIEYRTLFRGKSLTHRQKSFRHTASFVIAKQSKVFRGCSCDGLRQRTVGEQFVQQGHCGLDEILEYLDGKIDFRVIGMMPRNLEEVYRP